MRTKEIDVWVNAEYGKGGELDCMWNKKPSFDTPIKAKLIIELPERKVEITESQFDEIWSRSGGVSGEHAMFKYIKDKLFGVQS